MTISSLLDVSRRALNTQSTGIRVIGDNISNVNTPGYSRRRAEIVTTPSPNTGLEVGTGSNVNRVVRVVDNFLNQEFVNRIADRANSNIKSEFLDRAEAAFRLDGEPGTIGYQLNDFFGALQDLTVSPANIPLRTQVLQKGQDLVNSISDTYNANAQLQREADQRVQLLVTDVNRITQSISQLNSEISKGEIGLQEALTLRDQRDELLRELGEKISFKSIEDSAGKLTIYLSNGFSLVNGDTSNALSTTTTPSFAPVGGFPSGLDGQALNHIVFNFGGTSDVDLTGVLASGSGELGGILSIRGTQSATDTSAFDANGTLVEFGTRVELIARDLLTRFNQEYRGPDGNTALAAFNPSAVDLDGNNPAVFGLFSFNGAVSGNNFGDNDNDGIASTGDLNAIVAAGTVSNYASRITFNVSTERSLAAARDTDLATAATVYAQGDSSNLDALLVRRDATVSYSLGAVSESATVDGFYSLTVSTVGARSARASDDLDIYKSRESQVKELQQSMSGVNLDEEFAQLILFQKAFEASARLIGIGDELTSQIIDLLR